MKLEEQQETDFYKIYKLKMQIPTPPTTVETLNCLVEQFIIAATKKNV